MSRKSKHKNPSGVKLLLPSFLTCSALAFSLINMILRHKLETGRTVLQTAYTFTYSP